MAAKTAPTITGSLATTTAQSWLAPSGAGDVSGAARTGALYGSCLATDQAQVRRRPCSILYGSDREINHSELN